MDRREINQSEDKVQDLSKLALVIVNKQTLQDYNNWSCRS